MPRPKKLTPSYLPHKSSGRARVVWTDLSGARRQRLLPGAFNSEESLIAFAQFQLEVATSPVATSTASIRTPAVAEILLGYLQYASSYYVDATGETTAELFCMKVAIKPVRELYASLPADKFGPVALRAVRQKMIDSGLCRGQVNHRIDRVKRVFRWAASEELIPASTYDALRTLPGLRRGRCGVREAPPVTPVPDEHVIATLPMLPPHVRAMIALMWHTGMRPSEVCDMTMGQIDRSGSTWTYRPHHHKTLHVGKKRAVQLGPKARGVLLEFLHGRSFTPDEPLFSPRRQQEERFATLRKKRKSKVQPSQVSRKRAKPAKVPGEKYSPPAIGRAVALACKRAKVPHWFPYQLRHSFGTRVRKEAGLEGAQVLLGHSHAAITELYAERNEALAATIAAKLG